ncbi:MAG: SDR family oxidoreductase [Rhodobacterales bacterium]|nr:SDR family oxidoreductase [Rhodobacterales bacterium]
MPTVMITGAGRGLGLEFARQYAADRWKIIATCRDPDLAEGLRAMPGVQVHRMNVANFAEVEALAHTLRRQPVDLLINNAGIYGPRPAMLGGVDYDAWGAVMLTNVFAPLKVSETFADLVSRSDQKMIVTISSRMGSITENDSGGSYIYRSSKAALNQVMKSLSVDLAGKGITVGLLHPGWVRTDMGGPTAAIDAQTSVTGMRQVIAQMRDLGTGRFFNYDGTEIPW